MTEIEQFKKELAHFERCAYWEGIAPSKIIASLITTIESQQREIEKLKIIHEDYRRTALERIAFQEQQIETQKGEIDRLMGVNQHLEIDLSEAKAITELAVKGLESIKQMLDTDHSGYQKYLIWKLTFDALEEIGKKVLNETNLP